MDRHATDRASYKTDRLVVGEWHDLAAQYEIDLVEVVGGSRKAMLDEIRQLPFGTFRNAMRIDGYEKPLDLVAARLRAVRDEHGGVPLGYPTPQPR